MPRWSGRPRATPPRGSRSAAREQFPALQAHAVAALPRRLGLGGHRFQRAVLHAHVDMEALGGARMALDLMSGNRAAGCAEQRAGIPAVGDLAAEHRARHAADHRANASAFALFLALPHGDHDAAVDTWSRL